MYLQGCWTHRCILFAVELDNQALDVEKQNVALGVWRKENDFFSMILQFLTVTVWLHRVATEKQKSRSTFAL